MMPTPYVRRAMPSERRALEALQRRASLANPMDAPHIAAHPECIDIPEWQFTEGRVLLAELAELAELPAAARDAGAAVQALGFGVILRPVAGAAELDGLFVEPSYWRQGVGSLVLSACLAQAKAEGASEVTVTVNPFAQTFYAAHGFAVSDTVSTEFGPALRMRKSLDSSP